jgi:hypothetical protein
MPGPHQDNGVPWSPKPPTVNTNQVSPGHPGGGYNPNQNIPPPVNTNQGNNQGNNQGVGVSVHTNQPYKPPTPPLNYTMEDVMSDIALTHGSLTNPDGTPTKYGLSHAGKTGQLGSHHTLGSFIMTDSSGKPILDSSGNVIFTNMGKSVHDKMRDEGFVGQSQQIDKKYMKGLKDFVQGLSYEDIHGMEDAFWRDYTAPGGEGGYEDYGNLLDDRRAWQEQLYYGPKQSPQKEMRQQGFFDTMEDAYSEDIAETLDKGLYSKTFMHPGAGILPWGMEKKWATGRAKGGIVSLVGG